MYTHNSTRQSNGKKLSWTRDVNPSGMSISPKLASSVHSPGSQIQVCRSHWSKQRLWAGQGDETQGLPTLQPVSTLTALDGWGKGGASGLTPKRTPYRESEGPSLMAARGNWYVRDTFLVFPTSHYPSTNECSLSSPVCILLFHSGPLQSPALLPRADASPSNHGSHFPLSLFPKGGGQMGAKIINNYM